MRGQIRLFGVSRIVLFACFLLLTSFVQAQERKNITVDFKEEALGEVLKKLEKLSPYKILFTYDHVQGYKVTASLKNVTILDALKKVLEGKPFTYSEITDGKYITVKYQSDKKNLDGKVVTVKGVVLDKNKEPLPGVTVIIKGTSTGVATNADGMYEIVVPTSSETVLQFSCIGMKSEEVKVGKEKTINVTMSEEVNEVDEVVVNGIYTASKNSYTGAVSTVRSEDILAVSQTNLFKALTVLVPGMRIVDNNEQGSNPNYIPEIIIRGTTSIKTSDDQYGLNSPLIIVDGVETTLEGLYDMDVFDIERVDVLKDASATAIYGDKAANGVIVVTRKRVADSKLRMRYNFVPDIQFPDVSSYSLCNPRQKLELERRWGIYEGMNGEKEMEYNRKLKLVNSGVYTDWAAIPVRIAWSHSHSLSVTGRGGGLDYSVTARYGDAHGVMKGDFRRNYGIGFYFSYIFRNKLTVTFRSDIRKTDSKNSPYGSYSQWVVLNPYDCPYDEYGELIPKLSFGAVNPMYNASTGSFSKSKSKNISNNLTFRWDVMKGMIVNLSANLSLSDNRSDDYISSLHTSSMVGNESANTKGRYVLSGAEGTSWSMTGSVSYSLPFDDKGSILTTNVGSTITQSNSSSFGMEGRGFLKPVMNDINFARTYPSGGKPRGSNDYSASVGVFANLNFIFRNRYFLDGSYRSSGSSVLGGNNQWAPYWSFGIGWNAHNESFIKALSWISTFRFRGSIGFVGSGNFGGNMAQTIYTYGDAYLLGLGAIPSQLGNPDLKAQRTLNMNGGVVLDILEGRFQVNLDFYRQRTKDALLPIGLPLSTGAATVQANLGESLNWGMEISVSSLLVRTTDWLLRLTVNTHHTENKLMKISNALARQNEANMRDKGVAPKLQLREGESMDAIYAVDSWGINPANGLEVFLKKDTKEPTYTYNVEDMVALGDTKPWFEGSSSLSAAWRDISVGMAFSYTFGGYIYNSTRAAKVENIDITKNVDVRAYTERWVKPGDVVAYPKGEYEQQRFVKSARFVEKKNEVYLSSVSISYNLPQTWVRGIGLKRLTVGVTFSDVLRLSTVKYERGTSYPFMRGFNFMISPTF
ncbi:MULTISPECIES: SusC/RagA family TonB-linked outer membrane protein [Butyricimonas]|uniref:SusC/RagA family TonB-linked outer membrane protein n=1 Tax=Butyricimonas TaxID=574697 RepID=UPI001D06B2C3|nr:MULTISPECIES: SusC/RagA family TonB-linked outer membrane protein [Butyricimonas]MCB6972743.1 SusC/RagA family TonB-linked outer membrane protein [Butyricimonas synergistica]MCG4519751.1 SusC/RagA family TonB-linked outer membrane protein [Butyricimonas sp. DFI.6.44]